LSRYVAYPGSVVSRNDSQLHFVGIHTLRRLYQVPSNVVVVNGYRLGFLKQDGDMELRPLYSGNYPVFKTEEEKR
jgi:hypothetical protein